MPTADLFFDPVLSYLLDRPMTRAPLSTTRFVVAIAVSLAIALSSPFLGQIRSSIRSAFPRQFVWIVGGLVAAAVLAALAAAVMRITERRGLRYASLAASIVAAAAFTRWHASGVPDVDVVEVFHFVEYGLITLLFYRAWRPVEDASIFILPFLAAMIAGTIDEALQWFVPARVGEVNDVLLNGVAIGCGLLFSSASSARSSTARRARFAQDDLKAGCGGRLALAVFFHAVHSGYLVDDATVGLFVWRYSRPTLERPIAKEDSGAASAAGEARCISRGSQDTSRVVHVQERNK